jgi:hypothetical protein
LNPLAHGPVSEIGDLIGVACDRPDDRWADSLVDITLDFTQMTGEAARIKAERFVPAQLDATRGTEPPAAPDQLVRAFRRHLAGGSHHPARHPGGLATDRRCDSNALDVVRGPEPADGAEQEGITL